MNMILLFIHFDFHEIFNFNSGCIIYRMFIGVTPFYEATEYLMFNRIKKGGFPMSPVG